MNNTAMTLKDAKKAYALSLLSALREKGKENVCIVMPVFINEGTDENPQWEPTTETTLETQNPNPIWCAINVVTSKQVFNEGFMDEQYRSALIRMKRVSNTFKAGQVLTGVIYVLESTNPSNAANLEQDQKFINAEAQANELPCMIEGDIIYRKAMYTNDLSREDVKLPHDNDEEIRNTLAEIRIAQNNPQSKGIKDLAAKKGTSAKK